ncbi:MAG: RNA polymerase sigma factor [Planctomycetes bacterium]|nr:RNA polymerase sigma factor [Planctomycetota bacterium]
MTTEPKTPTNEELILAHQDSVWRFLVSIGCEPNLADDLTQETFLQVLGDGFEYRGPHETAGWLLRVAKHQFIDSVRKKKLKLGVDLEHAETRWQEFEAECAYAQRVQWLRECMDGLTERSREAVKQRYELELPREEMAKRLGIEPAGVKTLLERIRQTLRDCVQGKVDRDQA